ncbi:MAG TPA: ABC transporter ATP-binding protein [Albitalea sp.]|uniref:ABC transporter ATP-binding protein n=1 Tax=Piscinibacter sp. TaxID=1903157 RepID=UPI002ED38E60
MSATVHLELSGVALRAGGQPRGRRLFSDLGFAVQAGERWVVLGPNGAGKSSLLAAIAGVFPVDAGRVALQGRPLPQWHAPALADWRAWCPQFWIDPFPATVRETAAIARRRGAWWSANGGDVDPGLEKVLAELQLAPLADADVRLLSGGERQRVAVATALLQDAPLLLLDEPASHLDLAHQQVLLDILVRWSAQDRAVVASLHDINLAWDLATHAVLLDGRGAALAGTREAVMTPSALSRAFEVAVDRVEVCGQTRFWVAPGGIR